MYWGNGLPRERILRLRHECLYIFCRFQTQTTQNPIEIGILVMKRHNEISARQKPLSAVCNYRRRFSLCSLQYLLVWRCLIRPILSRLDQSRGSLKKKKNYWGRGKLYQWRHCTGWLEVYCRSALTYTALSLKDGCIINCRLGKQTRASHLLGIEPRDALAPV